MTYITIDTKTRQAQKFVELVETLPFAHILNEHDVATKKALASLKPSKDVVQEWQKEDVRKSVREPKENPSILIEEDVVFKMLK